MARSFRARFDGVCACCGEVVRRGDWLVMRPVLRSHGAGLWSSSGVGQVVVSESSSELSAGREVSSDQESVLGSAFGAVRAGGSTNTVDVGPVEFSARHLSSSGSDPVPSSRALVPASAVDPIDLVAGADGVFRSRSRDGE